MSKLNGEVIIKKYETDTTTPIQGAIIKIFDSNGNEIKLTTDENGLIKLKLKPGEYNYQEIEAPDGYVLNDNTYSFIITEDGEVIFKDNTKGIIFNDKIIYGDVIIRKYELNTNMPVSGAIIGIFDENGQSVLDENKNQMEFKTDKDGQIKFTIKPGIYQYKEIKAPEGYTLNDTMYKFTVSDKGKVIFIDNTEGIIYNKKIESVVPPENEIPGGTNTTIENPTPNNTADIKTGTLPYAGIRGNVIIPIIIVSLISIYFGVKCKEKYNI